MIPTVAAVCIANLLTFEKEILQVQRWTAFSTNLVGLLLALISAGSAIASYGYLNQPGVIDRFFAPDKVCPRVAIIQEDPGYYFHCLHYGAWKLHPSLWSTGLDGVTRWQVVVVLLLAVFLWSAIIAALGTVDSQVEDEDKAISI